MLAGLIYACWVSAFCGLAVAFLTQIREYEHHGAVLHQA
jgi:hypothetical protein